MLTSLEKTISFFKDLLSYLLLNHVAQVVLFVLIRYILLTVLAGYYFLARFSGDFILGFWSSFVYLVIWDILIILLSMKPHVFSLIRTIFHLHNWSERANSHMIRYFRKSHELTAKFAFGLGIVTVEGFMFDLFLLEDPEFAALAFYSNIVTII